MVGDTPADTLMGQQAALGLTVGVLTGVGGLGDLQAADVIVKDVNECVRRKGSQLPGVTRCYSE